MTPIITSKRVLNASPLIQPTPRGVGPCCAKARS
jgi:hypothetical protein